MTLDESRAGHDDKRTSTQSHGGGARRSQLVLANDLAQGLLTEVRKLQLALQEKEHALREMQVLIADLEKDKELAIKHLRQRDATEEKLKEDNWNLEVSTQDLQASLNEVNATLDKLHAEHSKAVKQLRQSSEQLEILRAEHEKAKSTMEAMKVRHEHDQQAHRRAQGTLHRDAAQLKKRIDDLQVELKITRAKLAIKATVDKQKTGPSITHGNDGDKKDDAMEEDDEDHVRGTRGAYVGQPSPSTSTSTAQNQQNQQNQQQKLEIDTLKQSLAHAHRMVTQLRSQLHKEKAERLDLRKMLGDAQEAVEALQRDDGVVASVTPTGGKGSLKKGRKVVMARKVTGKPSRHALTGVEKGVNGKDRVEDDIDVDEDVDHDVADDVDEEDDVFLPAKDGDSDDLDENEGLDPAMVLEEELMLESGALSLDHEWQQASSTTFKSLDQELQQSSTFKSLSEELAAHFESPVDAKVPVDAIEPVDANKPVDAKEPMDAEKPIFHDRGVNTDDSLLLDVVASQALAPPATPPVSARGVDSATDAPYLHDGEDNRAPATPKPATASFKEITRDASSEPRQNAPMTTSAAAADLVTSAPTRSLYTITEDGISQLAMDPIAAATEPLNASMASTSTLRKHDTSDVADLPISTATEPSDPMLASSTPAKVSTDLPNSTTTSSVSAGLPISTASEPLEVHLGPSTLNNAIADLPASTQVASVSADLPISTATEPLDAPLPPSTPTKVSARVPSSTPTNVAAELPSSTPNNHSAELPTSTQSDVSAPLLPSATTNGSADLDMSPPDANGSVDGIAQELGEMVSKDEALAWVKAGIADALAKERKEAAIRRRQSDSYFITKADAEAMAKQRVEDAVKRERDRFDARNARADASSSTSGSTMSTLASAAVFAAAAPIASAAAAANHHENHEKHENHENEQPPYSELTRTVSSGTTTGKIAPSPTTSTTSSPSSPAPRSSLSSDQHHIRMTGKPVQRTLSQHSGYKPMAVPTITAAHAAKNAPTVPALPNMPTIPSIQPQPSTSTNSTTSTTSKSSLSSSSSTSRLGILSGLIKLQPSASTPANPRSLRISTSNASLRRATRKDPNKLAPSSSSTASASPTPNARGTRTRQFSLMDRSPSMTTSLSSSTRSNAPSSYGNIKITEKSSYARTFTLPSSQQQQKQPQRARSTSITSSIASVSLPDPSAADGNVDLIVAITQTMIGEWMWKHTRQFGGSISENKHKRFFWVHPYTRTLYWSSTEPGVDADETRSKRAFIESINVIRNKGSDANLVPHSILVKTPKRELKLTATSRERHELWCSSLAYLLIPTDDDDSILKAPGTNMALTPMSHSPSTPSLLAALGDASQQQQQQQQQQHQAHNDDDDHEHDHEHHHHHQHAAFDDDEGDSDDSELVNVRKCCNDHDLGSLARA